MADRPMIFSATMVRALLDGRKTQTRRVLKPQPQALGGFVGFTGSINTAVINAPCAPGDRLWVREAQGLKWPEQTPEHVIYRADGLDLSGWRSPIVMPRWASRLTLTVTEVQVQRVQEISEADANAEGCDVPSEDQDWSACRRWFRDFWNSIHGPDAWDRNDWVAALTFDVARRNIDAPPLPQHVVGG